MTCLGAYFLTSQVIVQSSYWMFGGRNAFGMTLIPLLFGVGLLFWNSRSIAGWALAAGGALVILAEY